jgi:hypothetical protein
VAVHLGQPAVAVRGGALVGKLQLGLRGHPGDERLLVLLQRRHAGQRAEEGPREEVGVRVLDRHDAHGNRAG